MAQQTALSFVNLDGLDKLIAVASKEDFGHFVLRFLSKFSTIENFGAYHIADLANPHPVLSFWSGRISDYCFQKDADLILSDPKAKTQIVKLIQSVPDYAVKIDRWNPPQGSERRAIYDKNGVIERVAISSRDGRSGLRSFYLRSKKHGWFSDEEYAAICKILPIVHQLIGLRHKIIGTARHGISDGANATLLRNTGVDGFRDLTPREAEVCDLLLEGRSIVASALVMEVSEATVRTLRQRAYRRLHVGSARELMALFIGATGAGNS